MTGESSPYVGPERRRKPRIYKPFIAKIRGIDADGKPFEVDTVLDDLSASGLYLRLQKIVKKDATLYINIQLSLSRERPGPVVETEGVAVRVEPRPSGFFGLAVEFTKHRFIGEVNNGD